MRLHAGFLAPLLLAAVPSADYESAKRKFDSIETGKLPAGTAVTITSAELNAYAREEVPKAVPAGVRNPRLELGNGSARGQALVDFVKVQKAKGSAPNWLLAKLLEGERPVAVTARIESGGGRATVFVERVEISGLTIRGAALDFLIATFFRPYYPQAKIGEPFELDYRMERIEVTPTVVRVIIGR